MRLMSDQINTLLIFFSKCVINTDINTLWKKNQKTNVAWKFFLYKILKDNYCFFKKMNRSLQRFFDDSINCIMTLGLQVFVKIWMKWSIALSSAFYRGRENIFWIVFRLKSTYEESAKVDYSHHFNWKNAIITWRWSNMQFLKLGAKKFL